MADHLVWERPAAECGKKHQRKQRPIRDKESRKWLHSLEKTAQLQQDQPEVHRVNIADREGDIYDYFVTARRLKIDVLVRAAWPKRTATTCGIIWRRRRWPESWTSMCLAKKANRLAA
ncbi:MAG: hypothetical protein L6277_12015, partial [Desulfobacterales bacterium]|nr:hypothetical protein [Desulfobacterales bacterium]